MVFGFVIDRFARCALVSVVLVWLSSCGGGGGGGDVAVPPPMPVTLDAGV